MPFRLSLLFLLGANLIPLIGVLFFAWDMVLVLALFWIENLIIGGFNLLKMLIAAARLRAIKGLLLSLMFVLHYGVFCAAHGLLLGKLLGVGQVDDSASGPLGLFIDAAALLSHFIDLYSPIILFGVMGLVLSHFVSFVENFILRGGIFNQTPGKLMGKPYGQIMIMHVGLILGAVALQKFGSSIWLLGTVVILKIGVDYFQHLRRHNIASV